MIVTVTWWFLAAAAAGPLLVIAAHARRHGTGPVAWRWLSGHALDGCHRTNATWTRKATATHHAHEVVRWHHQPRLWRAGVRTGYTTAVLAALYGMATARTVTLAVLASSAALVLGCPAHGRWRGGLAVRGWRWLAGRRHYYRWVRPLHVALAPVAGHSALTRPADWLEVDRDRTRVVIELPAGFTAAAALKGHVLETATAKLAIEAPEPAWELDGPRPRLILRARPRPPRKAVWADIAAAVGAAPAARPVIGLGCGGQPASLNLAESPHILLSIPTGGGKSTLLRVLIPGMLAAGNTVTAILDIKWISHPWVKGGLPNVLLCQRIADIHAFLAWLGGEITRRNEVAWAGMDIEGRINADVGPRIVVVVEELNTTTAELNRHWAAIREPSDPRRSPAADGLSAAVMMGRQVRVHVIVAGQEVTAHSAGGGASREQFGTRILGRYSPGHWRMLAEEVGRMPPSSRHAGRVQVVTGPDAREVQCAELTGAQAVALAATDPAPWPPTLPVSLRAGVTVSQLGAQAADLVETVETVTPALPPGRDAIRLSDAVALGLLGDMTLAAARKASHRDGFPEVAARDGMTRLYDPAEVAEWHARRPP